jgi:hypothetical protein
MIHPASRTQAPNTVSLFAIRQKQEAESTREGGVYNLLLISDGLGIRVLLAFIKIIADEQL